MCGPFSPSCIRTGVYIGPKTQGIFFLLIISFLLTSLGLGTILVEIMNTTKT